MTPLETGILAMKLGYWPVRIRFESLGPGRRDMGEAGEERKELSPCMKAHWPFWGCCSKIIKDGNSLHFSTKA